MRDLQQLIKYGKQLGFTVKRTNGDHYLFKGYDHIIYVSSTSSDGKQLRIKKNTLLKISMGLPVHRP